MFNKNIIGMILTILSIATATTILSCNNLGVTTLEYWVILLCSIINGISFKYFY